MTPSSGVVILQVLHDSKVAAIATSAGPKRLLEAGLADAMTVERQAPDVIDISLLESDHVGEVRASFEIADRISREVRDARKANRLVVVLSGSCHTGVGSVAGLTDPSCGVIWLDCHGDFNTPETTQTGLLDGTTLASITGRCWKQMCSGVSGFSPVLDENVLLVGVRDLDPQEVTSLTDSTVVVIEAANALHQGLDALDELGQRTSCVYMHIDLDVLDPSVGRANAFVTEGGFHREDFLTFLKEAVRRCPIGVVSSTSYDPQSDKTGSVSGIAIEAASIIAQGG